mmetsp:Transcript_79963/g.159652  ORF Transcript_79963/g.159652 Transcript_79963/m.159652 type:complete len:179 (+) Transcript_79963:354-890(+)
MDSLSVELGDGDLVAGTSSSGKAVTGSALCRILAAGAPQYFQKSKAWTRKVASNKKRCDGQIFSVTKPPRQDFNLGKVAANKYVVVVAVVAKSSAPVSSAPTRKSSAASISSAPTQKSSAAPISSGLSRKMQEGPISSASTQKSSAPKRPKSASSDYEDNDQWDLETQESVSGILKQG